MPLLSPLKDCFGRRYALLTPKQHIPHPALRAEPFYSIEQARRFIIQLDKPASYWRHIYLATSQDIRTHLDDRQLLAALAQLLYRGKIKFFKLDSVNSISSKNLGYIDSNNTTFAIRPVNYLLQYRPDELKTFTEEKQALAFLAESGVTDKQLDTLLSEHQLDTTADSKTAAAKALVKGDLIVTVARHTKPPKPDSSTALAALVVDKLAGLGPPPDDEFKEISLDLADEFDGSLGGAHAALFDGVEYTLKTDTGEEHKGVLQGGKINIPKAKMNSGFELTFKDLPAFT